MLKYLSGLHAVARASSLAWGRPIVKYLSHRESYFVICLSKALRGVAGRLCFYVESRRISCGAKGLAACCRDAYLVWWHIYGVMRFGEKRRQVLRKEAIARKVFVRVLQRPSTQVARYKCRFGRDVSNR